MRSVGMLPLLLLLCCTTPTVASPTSPAPAAPAPEAIPHSHAARPIEAGHPAPDFAFATSYGWRQLHHLCAEGPVLLLFEPDEGTMLALQRDRDDYARRGVTVVAVRTHRDGDNWNTLARLGLTYALFSDPAGVVAGSFGLLDPETGRPQRAWCLVDGDGVVRRCVPGTPASEQLALEVEAALVAPVIMVAGDEAR